MGTRRCHIGLGVLMVAAGLIAPASAPAAHGPPLRALHGLGACLALDRERGCGRARGFPNPEFANQVALSADGHSLYLAALNDSSLGILRVDPVSGRIAQPAGPAGCLAENPSEPREVNCAAVRGFVGSTQAVAISPDDRTVYVTSTSGFPGMDEQGAVAVFARNGSGALAQLAGAAGCISSVPLDDCAVLPGITAQTVSVRADATRVYLGGSTLSSFTRDPGTGALTPLACESSFAGSCERSPFGRSLAAPTWVGTVGYARGYSPPGPDAGTDKLLALDGAQPAPHALPGAAGCRGSSRQRGCPRDRRLVGYIDDLSAIPGSLFVLSTPFSYDIPPPRDTPFTLAAYRLAPAGGLTTARTRCLSTTTRPGCKRSGAILGAGGLAATPRRIYVTTESRAVAIARSPSTGALHVLGSVGGLPQPNIVLVSSDGRFIYVVSSLFNSTGSVRVYAAS